MNIIEDIHLAARGLLVLVAGCLLFSVGGVALLSIGEVAGNILAGLLS